MKAAKVALLVLFLVAVIYVGIFFANQNGELVTIQLFNWSSPSYPKWQVLLSTLALGIVVSTLFFGVQLIVLETRVIRLRRSNQKLERALHAANGTSTTSTNASAERPLTAISPLEEDV